MNLMADVCSGSWRRHGESRDAEPAYFVWAPASDTVDVHAAGRRFDRTIILIYRGREYPWLTAHRFQSWQQDKAMWRTGQRSGGRTC